MTSNPGASRIFAAALAIVATVTIHAGWLKGLDRDARNVTYFVSA